MIRHLPVFQTVTEWEKSRTAPCWATCDCGWESAVVKDQTTAEWIHGQHMLDVGAIKPGDLA